MIAVIATIMLFDKTLFNTMLKARIYVIFLAVCIFFLGILCFSYGLCLLMVCKSCILYKCPRIGQLILKVGMGVIAYALMAIVGHLFLKPIMYWFTFELVVACSLPIFYIVVRY
ncbi:hypothetical protein Pint_25963 [Pistacia integerrima]|uniref:Uncharacterized protein n=1 Tax=Pistacia integerrima TaxID=434235 RepID=A0ACC0YFF8_9ROSI|nr:hypothetical protein Pint_25963 [Pistacia integerrima]